MISNVTNNTTINTTTKTPVVVDRTAMQELFSGLGKKPKLPRLQPPERIKANIRGEAGVTYTIFDRKGMANIVNHAEMTVLHELLAEIEKKIAEVNAAAQVAPAFSTN